MIFSGKAINGQFVPDNPVLYKQYLIDSEGKKIKTDMTRMFGRRTTPQNKYLWGVVYKMMAIRFTEINGEVVSEEDVHKAMAEKFNAKKRRAVNEQTGGYEEIIIPGSTQDMTTVQFSVYCKELQRWSAEFLGISIPDPQELEYDPNGFNEMMST